MGKSKIPWTERTWNPVTGCRPISAGCLHCYARRFAERFRGTPGHPYEQGFDFKLHPGRMEEPLLRRQSSIYFVCSMADLFQQAVPICFIKEVFATMTRASWHCFQVLTKRAHRLAYLSEKFARTNSGLWPVNIWAGVTVEDSRPRTLERIEYLKHVPAVTKFLSMEPLLEFVDPDLEGISWVIVGGETGPGARKMVPDAVRSVRDQCKAAGVPFFFKRWGAHIPMFQEGSDHLLDGREWRQWPQ